MGDGLYINLANIPAPNLDEWATKCIRWPVSLNNVVLGLLQGLTYPDIWDGTDEEKSTMVSVVQTLMVDLMLGVECAGDQTPDDDEPTKEYPIVGFEALESECEMAGCSIPYGALRWNDGVLEYMYCGNWYPVEGAAVQPAPPPDWQPDPLPDGLTAPSACAIAQKIAQTQATIVEKAMDSVGAISFIWGWADFIDDVNSAVPALDLDNQTLFRMFYMCWKLDLLGLSTEAQHPDIAQALACQYSYYITPSLVGVDSLTYSNLKSVDRPAMNGIVDDNDYVGAGATIRDLWEASLECIGTNDIAKLTTNVVSDGTENCDCPGKSILDDWPEETDWIVEWDFTKGLPFGLTLQSDNGITGITSGGLSMTTNTTGSETLGVWRARSTDAFVLTHYYVDWYMGLAWNSADWGLPGPTVNVADIRGWVGTYGTNECQIYRDDLSVAGADMGWGNMGFQLQGDYDATKTPVFPVIRRIWMGGTGSHPFGGLYTPE